MKILDKYIIDQHIKTFVGILLIIVLIVFLTKMHFIIEIMLGEKTQIIELLSVLFNMLPESLLFSAPLAILLSSAMVVANMVRNSEIDILSSIGVSLFRIIIPFLPLIFLVFFLSYYISVYRVHLFTKEYRTLSSRILEKNFEATLVKNRFVKISNDTALHIKSFTKGGIAGIFIVIRSDKANMFDIIEAKSGKYLPSSDESEYGILLSDGSIHMSSAKDSSYQRLSFDRYYLPIFLSGRLKSANERIGNMSIEEIKDEVSKSFSKSKRLVNKGRIADLQFELYHRYSNPVSVLVLGFLGILLGLLPALMINISGIGSGVTIVIVSYIIDVVGKTLGVKGNLDPLLGGWLQNIVMASLLLLILVYFFIHRKILFSNFRLGVRRVKIF